MGEGADEVSPESDTLALRSDIERTRAEMSATIDAIQERLSPQHIADQVRHQVREQFEEAKATVHDATIGKAEAMLRDAGETVSEARASLIDTIRENPIPSAMVGIGLGWLLMNRRSHPQHRTRYTERYQGTMQYYPSHPAYRGDAMAMRSGEYYDREGEGMMAQGQRRANDAMHRTQDAAGHMASRMQETAGDAASRAQEAAANVASRVQDTASDVADRVQDAAGTAVHRAQDTAGMLAERTAFQAQRVEDRFRNALRDNPLGVGALALALGTAVGIALPGTERENELMGEARDSLVERAQEKASETLDKAQQVAGEVMGQAETTAREKSREVGLTKE
jgi:hypothetical protein